MAGNDAHGVVDQHRIVEAKGADRFGDLGNLALGVRARIALVRLQHLRRDEFNLLHER